VLVNGFSLVPSPPAIITACFIPTSLSVIFDPPLMVRMVDQLF
jgi:hypothetical protein